MNDEIIIEKEVIKDIINIIREIKRCHSKSMYNILISDLSLLYDLAQKLNIYSIPNIDDFSYKTFNIDENKTLKDMLKMYNSKHEFYREFLENYMDLFSENYIQEENKFDLEYLISKRVNIKESVELTRDFLSKNNIFLYDKLTELSKNHRIIYLPIELKYIEYYGFTYHSSSNKFKPYILLYDLSTISTSITLVHELGHVYDFEFTKNNVIKERINKCYGNYEEVYSHYIELLFYDFLEEQKVFEKDVDVVKATYINSIFRRFRDLEDLLYRDINNLGDIYYNYTDIFSIPEYTLGMVLAYEFYDMYKKDKEKTIINIHDFLINYGKDTELKYLDSYGLNREKILSGDTLRKYIYTNYRYY